MPLPAGGVELIRAAHARLAKVRGGAWKVSLLELRLEARGRAPSLRLTAEEMEESREHRWRLGQGLIYPTLLSLFFAGALLLLGLMVGRSNTPAQPHLPATIVALTAMSLSVSVAFPLLIWQTTRGRRLPGRRELLLLLREALTLSSSLGAAVRLLRKTLLRNGLPWAALQYTEALLLEGRLLEHALEPLSPPLAKEDTSLLSSRPDRESAISTLDSLIRHGSLRERSFRERETELLPAAALIVVGAQLLLIVTAVILPLFEAILQASLW